MSDNVSDALSGRVVLVTGASRGVGARVAVLLGGMRAKVAINYRSKVRRAEEVADEVRCWGGEAFSVQADLTDREATAAMIESVVRRFGRIDVMVLNASGGLERDRPSDYAMRLNRDGQVRTLEAALPWMQRGGRVIFVTSHLAHFHGQKPVPEIYEPVAASKRAGEDLIRAEMPKMETHGVSLVIVSGDLIDGTTTPRLMARKMPGLIEMRRQAAGWLPTVDDFAQAIVDAAAQPALETGATIYVGSTG